MQVRHEPICQKTQQKKRKVFDSSKQRAEGTEVAAVKKRGPPGQQNRVSVHVMFYFFRVNLALLYGTVLMFGMVEAHVSVQNLPVRFRRLLGGR